MHTHQAPATAPARKRMSWRTLAGALLPIGVFLWGYHSHPPANGIIEDEVYWIGSAYYYDLAVIQHDLYSPDWQLLPARENPPVGKYVFGLALQAMGSRIRSPDALSAFYLYFSQHPKAWGQGEDYQKRLAVTRRISPSGVQALQARRFPIDERDLWICRRVNLVMTLAATLALYALACLFLELPGAIAAATLFVLQPAVVTASRVALIDMIALAFSTLCVLALARAVRHAWPSEQRISWLWASGQALLVGTLLALACGTKMNALIVAALVGGTGAFYALRGVLGRRGNDLVLAAALFAALAWATGLFIALDPTLYPDVGAGLAALFDEPKRAAAIQDSFLKRGLHSTAARIRWLAQETFTWRPLGLILAGFLLYHAIRGPRNNPVFWLVGAWWLLTLVLLLAWLPFAFSRYILPLVPPSALLAGGVVDTLVPLLRNRASRVLGPQPTLR